MFQPVHKGISLLFMEIIFYGNILPRNIGFVKREMKKLSKMVKIFSKPLDKLP
jgi:hypothetical protein